VLETSEGEKAKRASAWLGAKPLGWVRMLGWSKAL
jgi:hypothetical protein